MDDDHIRSTLRILGKRRRKITQEAESLRREIHDASIEAASAGWNNQQIATEIGVTREIIRRHVGPSRVEHGEQDRS